MKFVVTFQPMIVEVPDEDLEGLSEADRLILVEETWVDGGDDPVIDGIKEMDHTLNVVIDKLRGEE